MNLRRLASMAACAVLLTLSARAADPNQNSSADKPAPAVEPGKAAPSQAPPKQNPGSRPRKFHIRYSRKGLELSNESGNYKVLLNGRIQLRYFTPLEVPMPDSPSLAAEQEDFKIQRARIKGKGNVLRPWLKFAFEQDLVNNRLLTASMTVGKLDWLQLKFGQWKAEFNRERVNSSGDQQFAERSIVTPVFTIDRQQSVLLTGRLMKGTRFDSRYFTGVLSGTGRGVSNVDEGDGRPMLMARYQWNFLKRDLDFSHVDLARRSEPAASLAFAWVSNRSRYTRFSSSGGGQLPGFERGEKGQYSIRQFMQETAFQYRGFSFQNEFHWKRIVDNKNLRTTHLRGGYAQTGFFFHTLIEEFPRPLETAVRYAFVDLDTSRADDLLHEFTFAVNWYFEGHNNKLTFDIGRLRLEEPSGDLARTRYRAQWEITF